MNSQQVLQSVSIGRPGQCWPWQRGKTTAGYGSVYHEGKHGYAHRLMFEWFRGPIPKGMFIDHKCRNRKCCNPAHLRIATPRQNVLENNVGPVAANVLKTHCLRGHPFSGENLYVRASGGRECRACRSTAMKSWWAENGHRYG